MEKLTEREGVDVREGGDPATIQGDKLTGYAILWGQKSRPIYDHHGSGYIEVIEKGALTFGKNVTFTYRHQDTAEYGDTASGTLRLTQDDIGIKYELDVPAYANTLRQKVTSKEIKGMSIGYHPRGVTWKDGVRYVHQGELVHISPVINPAFPQTTIGFKKPSSMKQKYLDLASPRI